MGDLKVALEELKEETDSGRLSAAGPAAAAPSSRRWRWTAALAFFLVACGAGVWLWPRRAASPPTLQKVALTTYAGSERSPSLSPDGKYVAFTWDGEKGDNFDVYVKLIDAGEPLRLTRNPLPEYRPRWSPDGRQITFTREAAIFSIAPLGGTEKKLVENVTRGYDWLPTGNGLIAGIAGGLEVIDLSSGARRRVTSPSQGQIDYNPRVSPDGRHIVFVRIQSDQGQQSIFSIPVEGGEARVIASQEGFNQDPAWMPGSREVLFHRQWGPLLRVPFTGGMPVRVPESDESIGEMDVSAAGNRLIYSKVLIDLNIYSAEPGPEVNPRRIVASSRRDLSPAVSPDGQRLAYSSDRSGESAWEIWICDAEGGGQVQLTSFGKGFADGATWSPDGREIAFSALTAGNRDIYRINPDGGSPTRLTTEPSDDGRPRYSRDGKMIYFRSDRGGRAEIWKMPRGGGPAVPVTSIGGFDAWESDDGKTLYFTKARNTLGLWSMPVSGGEAQPVRGLERVRAGLWVPSAAGIHWIDTTGESSSAVLLSTPGRGTAKKLFSLSVPLWPTAPGLSVSPDGRRIFWHQADQFASDLVLIDNFR
jgi:Tol biopolymer transport system component